MLAECRCRLLHAFGHASTRCAPSRARRLLGLGGLSTAALAAGPRLAPDNQLISSPENEIVRRIRRLAQRREPGLVLLEGPRVIAEAEAAGLELELIAVREGDEFDASSKKRVTLSRGVFRAVSQTVTPQGVIAIARVEELDAKAAIEAARGKRWPLVVLDGVQDPGNVGAICRSAAAAAFVSS